MAHFIGYLQGNRDGASRLGSKNSGIQAQAQGWYLGASIEVYYDEKAKEDRVRISLTRGSGISGQNRFLGTFRRKGNQIVKVS